MGSGQSRTASAGSREYIMRHDLDFATMRQSLWDMFPFVRELRELNDRSITGAQNIWGFFVYMPIVAFVSILFGIWWWRWVSYYETPQKQKRV
jgi:hypothetical protein